MLHKFVLCVAVITLVSDSANGESVECDCLFSHLSLFTFHQPLLTAAFIEVIQLMRTILILTSSISLGLIKRCYQCRSRGELGSCKDPFRFNASHIDTEPGVTAVPCASGWCGKVIEGETGAFREDGKVHGRFQLSQ